jgi:DNA-binding XRE family transcriptional regulator
MTKDRNHYRLMSSKELVEEAKYSPNVELCIALGERLDRAVRRLEDYRYDYEANNYDKD